MINEFKPLSLVEIEDLSDCISFTKAKVSPKDIVTLERNGYVMVYGGDQTFGQLQAKLKYVDVKQFDKETWYLKRQDYTLTDEDRNTMSNMGRYNGNLKV